LKGYLDDGIPSGRHGALDVLGSVSGLVLSPDAAYITALGNNTVRRQVVSRLGQLFGDALSAWTLIHPAAYIGENVEIGEGACLAPGAILTAGVRIGRHSIVNVKASVSHDCTVGDFVNLNPAATVCGWVTIGEGAFIGAGATIKDKVSIGAWSVIGAGAAVVRDIPANVTAVGVPARVVKNTGLLACQAPPAR
jgi:acetyltransferase EpsM